RVFLERLAGDRLRRLPVDDPGEWTAAARDASLVRAIGEENEVREVFRRCLARAVPFDDAQILHTDERVYPALVLELSRQRTGPPAPAPAASRSRTPGPANRPSRSWRGSPRDSRPTACGRRSRRVRRRCGGSAPRTLRPAAWWPARSGARGSGGAGAATFRRS